MNKIARVLHPPCRLILLALACLAIPALALAGDAPQHQSGTGFVEPKAYALSIFSNSNITSLVGSYGAEIGYNITDSIDVGVEVLGAYLQEYQHASGNLTNLAAMYGTMPASNSIVGANGVGGNALVDWHFYQNGKTSIFVGGGLGFTNFDKSVPVGANPGLFTQNFDLGFTANITNNIGVKVTARYQHLGEFNYKGLDGVGGGLGLTYSF